MARKGLDLAPLGLGGLDEECDRAVVAHPMQEAGLGFAGYHFGQHPGHVLSNHPEGRQPCGFPVTAHPSQVFHFAEGILQETDVGLQTK